MNRVQKFRSLDEMNRAAILVPPGEAFERFARRLVGRYLRPVAFIDERLSSHAAQALRRGTRHTLDALAAQQILETWLMEAAQSPEQK